MRVVVPATLALLTLTACGPEMFASGDATLAQLKKRAAFDMNCPESKLRTVTIDDRTRGVSGCDERVTYVESCDRVGQWGAKDNCTWVLNTVSKRRAHKPAPRPEDDSADDDTGGDSTPGDADSP